MCTWLTVSSHVLTDGRRLYVHPLCDVGTTLSSEDMNLGRQVAQQGTQERPCPVPWRKTSDARKGSDRPLSLPP